MRLLSLDFDPVYGDATMESFSGDRSVFDFDLVIWDPAETFTTYMNTRYLKKYQGLPSLDEETSVRIISDTARRRSEFVDFVTSGRTLVVIVRPSQECYIDTGERRYSGTGRNRVTTNIVSKFDLLTALPIDEETRFLKANGERTQLDGSGPVVNFLKKYKERIRYEAVISKAPGISLGHVPGTDRTIGSVFREASGGHLILLPRIALELDNVDEKDYEDDEFEPYIDEAPQFQQDLIAAVRDLAGSGEVSRPAWIDLYTTKEQQDLHVKIVKQQEKIEVARAQLAKLQQKRESIEAKEQLFLGTGRTLELEVRKVLELLGGTVTEPEPGRDDWRVQFPEGNAVVEVKGVTKSAAEKHAAQLEKWVASSLEESGNAPKGILIVNTWRELPLTERKEEDFPPQMIPYSKGRNHCLITGLQLYVMRSKIERSKAHAKEWRKKILETSGKLVGCEDWKSVISEGNFGEDTESN